MHFSIKDVAIYAVIGLSAAVLVNSYAELNIPFLNSIERAVIPSSTADKTVNFDYTHSEHSSAELSEECKRFKTTGDSKTMLRAALRQAVEQKDTYKARELEEKLQEVENREREACR